MFSFQMNFENNEISKGRYTTGNELNIFIAQQIKSMIIIFWTEITKGRYTTGNELNIFIAQ